LLKALIAGKINRCVRLEDSLTSDVFGVADYIANPELLARFFERARASDGKSIQEDVLKHCTEFEVHMWPKFSDGTEPDVLVVGLVGLEVRVAILVECKYHSTAWESEEDPAKESDLQEKYRSQLIAYGKNFANSSFEDKNIMKLIRNARHRLLVYLTADYSLPREGAFPTSAQQLEAINVPAYWLSWRDLSYVLREKDSIGLDDKGKKRMIQDLLVGVEDRRNLRRFRHLVSGLPARGRFLQPSALRCYARRH